MFSSKDLFFTPAAGGYTVSKSLRFRSSATAYLDRTPSAGNQTTWTWSAWVKRGSIGSSQVLLSANRASASEGTGITFTSSDTLQHYAWNGSAFVYNYITTQVFRDPSAWYHLVVVLDTSNGTSTDRVQLYINGVRVTAFGTSTAPSSGASGYVNAAQIHAIGRSQYNTTFYFDGYMADVNFIGGSALLPTDFGAYDTNGVWQPKAYTGSYSGTNSFYLKFTDVGATSGSNTGYGQDFSGNGNYWTTNNFGTTSTATTYDSMLDSPTNATGDIGNYCVISPINSYSSITISNANLTATLTEAAYRKAVATMAFPTSGKYYVEAKLTGINYASFGVVTPTAPLNDRVGATATGYGVVTGGTQWDKWDNGTSTGNFWSISTTSPTLQIAIDTTNGKLWIGYNDTWLDGSGGLTGNPAAGTNATFTIDTSRVYLPAVGGYKSDSIAFDFTAGQRPFTYTPPSGFSALNTQNLSTPTITDGAQYMAAVTYTGTGSSQTITASSTNSGNNPNGTTFQPDFVWVKGRSGATDHALYDAVRGVQLQLESNTTGAETTETTGLTAFTSSGFTTGALAQMNTNTATYVAWEWNAGGSTVTNTTGTISAQVRANTSAGFSVVTYTGTGTSPKTVGHGLGVAPSLVIVKCRVTSAVYNGWGVYHSSVGATKYLELNATGAAATSANWWNDTDPTSSVFSIGSQFTENTSTYVAYCFAPVAGYSAFGSYTGNASTDGPMIFTGFRPRWLLVKIASGGTGNWELFDSSRNTYNQMDLLLLPSSSNAESGSYGSYYVDFLSNGFKIRGGGTGFNASGETIIYAAFAENPFKYSRAR